MVWLKRLGIFTYLFNATNIIISSIKITHRKMGDSAGY